MLMVPLVVAVIVVVALEVLVWRHGADTRDGHDWAMPKPTRRSPLG
jgi:hypothetical protein